MIGVMRNVVQFDIWAWKEGSKDSDWQIIYVQAQHRKL
jgi:hypothetical protein